MNSIKIKKEEYFENDLNTMIGVLKEKNKRGIRRAFGEVKKKHFSI